MEKDENILKEAEEEAKRIHDLEAQAPVEQSAESVQAPTPAPVEPINFNLFWLALSGQFISKASILIKWQLYNILGTDRL